MNLVARRRTIGVIAGAAPALSPYEWYDPDLGAWQDLALTTPATANNDPVAALVGQVGNLGNMVNSAGTTRPLLKTGSLNAHGTILFDGSDDFLAAVSSWTPPGTLVLAVNTFNYNTFQGPVGDPGFIIAIEGAGGSPNMSFRSSTQIGALNPQPGLSAWVIISLRVGTVGGDTFPSSRVNNNARVVQGVAGDNQVVNTLQLAKSALPRFSNCQIGRVAIYNSKLSQTDEDTVVQSFMTYYGL